MDNDDPEICKYKQHQLNNIKRLVFIVITYSVIMFIGVATAVHSNQVDPIYVGFVCSVTIFWLAGIFNPKVWRYDGK